MTASLKIQTHHLKRNAYLYIRQSSMQQVVQNTESTKRQYALQGRAKALGWSQKHIVVIDSDQGKSGTSSTWRQGFQRLVSDVGLGRAGIVIGLEVSRLARNNADWHRLLEICALTETLILDEDGVYDPMNFNDRLLLGLKGTMSEAEIHLLKARLRGGILNKVRRGEYRCLLPTGFVYDEAGDVILDPDVQVQKTIAYFFETFSRVGSAHQTVKSFRKEELCFPSRVQSNGDSTVVFRPLTASAAMRTLNNPRYAGTYAYGRRRSLRTIEGKKSSRKRDFSDWLACIPDAHPGYITWEQYNENLKILKTNGRGYKLARSSPPREGAALLQGRAVCGRCGRHLRVRYASRRDKNESWYVCDRGSISNGEPNCQSISGLPVDKAIGILIAEKMTPEAVELALEIRKEIETRQQEADQLHCQAIERAKVEADMAQRRFMMVSPENRLVADTLEATWNDKLRTVAKAREDREQFRREYQDKIASSTSERLERLATDFNKIWADPVTPNRERKRMLAYLIEDTTLIKMQTEGVTKIHIRFKSGKTETLTTLNPKSSAQQIKTPSEIVTLVDKLLDDHIYDEIADQLNAQRYKPGGSVRKGCQGKRFDSKRVAYIVNAYGLRPRYDRLRDQGLLTRKELAALLDIHEHTLARWAEYGIVQKHAYKAHVYLYEAPGPSPPVKHSSRWNTLVERAAIIQTRSPKNQTITLEAEEV